MSCTKLSASGPRNSRRTRESRHMWLVKFAQKAQENGQTHQKGQQNWRSCKKVSTIFSKLLEKISKNAKADTMKSARAMSCELSSGQSWANSEQWWWWLGLKGIIRVFSKVLELFSGNRRQSWQMAGSDTFCLKITLPTCKCQAPKVDPSASQYLPRVDCKYLQKISITPLT